MISFPGSTKAATGCGLVAIERTPLTVGVDNLAPAYPSGDDFRSRIRALFQTDGLADFAECVAGQVRNQTPPGVWWVGFGAKSPHFSVALPLASQKSLRFHITHLRFEILDDDF